MAVDWADTSAEHVIRVVMVSQTNLNDQLGELDGVELSGSSVEWGYYTDLRCGGKLRVRGEGWKRGTFLRIYHDMPDYGFSETLGTYIVANDNGSEENGTWVYELELKSTLQMFVEDKLKRPWVIAKGASVIDCLKQVIGGSGAHSMRKTLASLEGSTDTKVEVDTSLSEEKQANTAQIMKAGQGRLECMFALCSMSNNRLNVNEWGNPTIAKRRNLASTEAKYRIDLADARGVVVDGSLKRTTDWLSIPDTVVVEHTYTKEGEGGNSSSEQVELYGEAHVAASDSHAVANRGYSIVHFESLQNLNPKTSQRANEEAQRSLKLQTTELVEWELETTYLPLRAGDVVELVVHSGPTEYRGVRKCFVKDAEVELQHMTMKLTLKETASGDKGDD